MQVYIYTCIHIYIYIYLFIYMHVQVYTHVSMYFREPEDLKQSTAKAKHGHMGRYYTSMHVDTYGCICIYIYTHVYKYIYTYVFTSTYVRPCAKAHWVVQLLCPCFKFHANIGYYSFCLTTTHLCGKSFCKMGASKEQGRLTWTQNSRIMLHIRTPKQDPPVHRNSQIYSIEWTPTF